jgi:uncharacterized protein YecT (DUF1311 family)
MSNQVSAAAIAVLAACLVSAPASAQIIDPNYYYKLSTEFRGSDLKLDVFNGGPKNNMTRLEPDQDVSGQFWRLAENPDGTFRLSSWFRPGLCLDVFNGGPNNNQPHLTGCGNYTGQSWNVMLAGQGELVRLTTRFRGADMCLDVFNGGPNNNQPRLARCDNYTGQLWTLTKTDKRVKDAADTGRRTGADGTGSLPGIATLATSLAAIAVGGTAAPLGQAEGHTSKAYAECIDRSGGVTSAMQDCMGDEFEGQDRRLNAAYKALMGSVSGKNRVQLRDAQRKWIAFRDANCDFYDDPLGGSAARLAANECVVTLTADRAHELETLKRE